MIIIYILISVCILLVGMVLFFQFKAKNNKNDLTKSDLENIFTLTKQQNLCQIEMIKLYNENVVKEVNNFNNNLEKLTTVVDGSLNKMAEQNEKKLEQMRATVDEKLHDTLEKRLGESFKLVNERLESVYKGLGEMQNLATGVGDLKKVLTNVKARGSWGEVSLGNILEQFLTTDQYEKNAKLKAKSKDFVEFAIKIPSKIDGKFVMMPIDSKFPVEDYNRLIKAEELGDIEQIKFERRELEKAVKKNAMDIRDKYINPPYTTDFGVMFLPIESLYCEILRNSDLCEMLQREYRVTITGPTTLSAFINSLQLGFRALAIEKQTSEVWKVLATVKSEFGKFGDILAKTNKKLQEISNTMQDAESKTRTIQNRLSKVETLAPIDKVELIAPISNSDDTTY